MRTLTLRFAVLSLVALCLSCGRPVEKDKTTPPAPNTKPDDAVDAPVTPEPVSTPVETPADPEPPLDLPNPTTPAPAEPMKVDFIWVVDESGSMADDRAKLSTLAATFIQEAVAQGIDLRVGVTGVMSPTGAHAASVGKLCSAASSDPADLGGVDRFLDATEVATLAECVRNPPALEVAIEHPISNAHAAIAAHLPRAAADPSRLRDGAKVVVVFFTDEQSEELRQLVPGADGQVCTLDPATQGMVDQALAAEVAFFAQHDARAYVIGGACNPACYGGVPHGLLALAQATGGGGFDLCAPTLEPAIKQILADVAAMF